MCWNHIQQRNDTIRSPMFRAFLLLLLAGPAHTSVKVNQWTSETRYTLGDTAILHCNITSDQEVIENCEMHWVIMDINNKNRTIDVLKTELYKQRVNIESIESTTSMTLRNLTLHDRDMPNCTAECYFDGQYKRYFGMGSVQIFEEMEVKEVTQDKTTVAPSEL